MILSLSYCLVIWWLVFYIYIVIVLYCIAFTFLVFYSIYYNVFNMVFHNNIKVYKRQFSLDFKLRINTRFSHEPIKNIMKIVLSDKDYTLLIGSLWYFFPHWVWTSSCSWPHIRFYCHHYIIYISCAQFWRSKINSKSPLPSAFTRNATCSFKLQQYSAHRVQPAIWIHSMTLHKHVCCKHSQTIIVMHLWHQSGVLIKTWKSDAII